jgi:predicted enzyme related to lactoylglutathione lyase
MKSTLIVITLLFGWQFSKADLPGPEYWFCRTGGEGPGIDGAIMQRQDAAQPWMNYIDVASIDGTIEKAVRMGATVALPKTPIAEMGFIAAVIDPQGNLFGLWEMTAPAV